MSDKERTVQRAEGVVEWKVEWASFDGETRARFFTDEAAARGWFDYATTGWGPDATARLSSREAGPWEEQIAVGPAPT